VVGDGQPDGGELFAVQIDGGGVQQPEPARHLGREHQPHAHRLAVTPGEVLLLLDRMSQRVAVVEGLPPHLGLGRGGGLAQVGGHHVRLEPDRAAYELGETDGTHVEGIGGVLSHQLGDAGVADETGLDDLRHAGRDLGRRQRGEQIEVAEHADRLVEGAHQVLAPAQVDRSCHPPPRHHRPGWWARGCSRPRAERRRHEPARSVVEPLARPPRRCVNLPRRASHAAANAPTDLAASPFGTST
jgi:hypothetical protein